MQKNDHIIMQVSFFEANQFPEEYIIADWFYESMVEVLYYTITMSI